MPSRESYHYWRESIIAKQGTWQVTTSSEVNRTAFNFGLYLHPSIYNSSLLLSKPLHYVSFYPLCTSVCIYLYTAVCLKENECVFVMEFSKWVSVMQIVMYNVASARISVIVAVINTWDLDLIYMIDWLSGMTLLLVILYFHSLFSPSLP